MPVHSLKSEAGGPVSTRVGGTLGGAEELESILPSTPDSEPDEDDADSDAEREIDGQEYEAMNALESCSDSDSM